MAKLLSILVASAAIAGGTTYAFFHYADPYHCPLSSCEVAPPACCAHPTAEVVSPTDCAVAAAGSVAMFTEAPVSACCSAKTTTRAACCATVEACCPAPSVAAVVGPAAAVR